MVIDKEFLEGLSAEAKANPRLRKNYDLRTSGADRSQRMLNAMEPGTVIPVHRHRATSETMIVVAGRVRETFFDDSGDVTEVMELGDGCDARTVQIPVGQWHTAESLAPCTVIFEAKDGPYEPLDQSDILNV